MLSWIWDLLLFCSRKRNEAGASGTGAFPSRRLEARGVGRLEACATL